MEIPPNTSLIETMHGSVSGDITLLELHLDRLLRSARALCYATPAREVIREKVLDHLARQPLSGVDLRIRLLMDQSGKITLESFASPPLSGAPFIAVSPVKLQSDEFFLQHKTTYRPWYASATSWLAAHPDFFDVIYLNEKNEVCEGSRSNIYLWQDGIWVTPPLACGLLGGVQRRQLLEQGQVIEQPIPAAALETKNRQLRLSNALRGWFDVCLKPFPGWQDRNF